MTSVVTSDSDLGPVGLAPETAASIGESERCFDESDDDSESCDAHEEAVAPLGAGRESSAGFEAAHASPSIRDLDDTAFTANPVVVVHPEGLRAMGEVAASLNYLWIQLDPPGPQQRGRLGLYLEESIELHLEERGALPPGIQASTGLDASLSDQLYRARLVEMRGIALGIPSLEGITNLGRSLDAEDSAVLRWWIAAAADRPVRLVISSANTKLRVYPSPVLFESLFDVAPEPVTPMPPSLAMAESAQSMELSDLPPPVAETDVLGTEVELLARVAAGDDYGETGDDYGDTGGEYGQEEDELDSHADVDLPDLDRALGLTPQLAEPHSALFEARPHVSATFEAPLLRKSATKDASVQLPLDYESPVPVRVHTQNRGARPATETRIASPAPPAQIHEFKSSEEQEVESFDTESSASESISEDSFAPEHDDDLDADEFLRTLEADSSKAPVVAEPEAPAPVEFKTLIDSAPPRSIAPELAQKRAESAPLLTKKIERSPFIRLANPAEAIDEESPEIAADSDESGPRNTIVDVSPEGKHAATLSGAAAPDPNDPFNQLAAREWKSWVSNLEAARGPKPLAAIERMFVTDYTRLREAVRRGVADSSANAMLDEWQQSFAKSYSEAFDALRSRGKRPTMVLDIPELAERLGRLHGAKRVQLLLVDGLRFDLGLMVQSRMRETADAALTERLLLWSALPSVTSYQLELLGKGPDGLKQPGDIDEPESLVSRGPASRVPRRVRTGTLELSKLDVVEDLLRQGGAPILERMDSIAEETASAIVAHISKQPPRTMVVAFGDHGFALDPTKAGTSAEATHGGSSPEEVLVPAFAWLTGAVH